MIEFTSVLEQRHSPEEWDEYMKQNISLADIVEDQKNLMDYQRELIAESTLMNVWLEQSRMLLEQRLVQQPAA
jgi:hypothetical protein